MKTATQSAGGNPRAFRPLSWVYHLLNTVISIGAVIVLLWVIWGSLRPMDLRARGNDH